VPVLTIRPDDSIRHPYRNVLVPTDGSASATAALDLAAAIETEPDATLHLLSVIEVAPPGLDVHAEMHGDQLEAQAKEILEDATATAEAAGVESISDSIEIDSSIERAILSHVETNDIDLVVMGTRGRSGLDRYLLGSVAEKVVRTAPVPVLTVPDPDAGSS
jgi:nucleotide-binding universal stress UspA family protein